MNERFTEEVSRIALERLRNPYIIAFIISWICFNWQPLLFFVFSKGNVEYKIKHIVNNYSDIWFNLIYPLLSALFYIFLLPRINKKTENINYSTIKERADHVTMLITDKISREEKIALAEDKKQKAIAAAKESTDYNNFINELQNNIKNLQDNLNKERFRNQKMIEDNEIVVKELNDSIKKEFENNISRHSEIQALELQNNSLKSKNITLEKDNEMKQKELENTRRDLNLARMNNLGYIEEINKIKSLNNYKENRLKASKTKLITTSDRAILEYINKGELLYFDNEKNEFITIEEAKLIIERSEILETKEPENFKHVYKKMLDYMLSQLTKDVKD